MIAARVGFLTLVLTGLVYPLAGTGFARLLFPRQSAGSLLVDSQGHVTGSALIGQRFAKPRYFQGRPSAAGDGYDATASGGSNLGPTSQKLKARADADRERLSRENPDAGPVPTELVSASASGLDPHISPDSARWQIARVARARGVAVERVRMLVEQNVEQRDLWVLGEPRVNVLLLNRALDEQFGP